MKELCPHCGASMMANTYTMNRTLLRALAKMLAKPGPARDTGMTKSEYSVYTKLKFWGFIARIEDGEWFVTGAGRDFLAGLMPAAKEITYFRNKLVGTTGSAFVWDILPTEESKQKYRELMRPILEVEGGKRLRRDSGQDRG